MSRVLDEWLLEGPLVMSEVAGGATNRVYEVEDAHGAAYLRRYRRADPERVAREHGVIHEARAGGVPAARPLPARNGRTVVQHDGAVYALYEPASGVQLGQGSLTLESIARQGRKRTARTEFSAPGARRPDPPGNVSRSASVCDMLAAQPRPDCFSAGSRRRP